MSEQVTVLVVDDSAFARKVLSECLRDAGFDVVGAARDGLEALEMIEALSPEVVTLDLVMPNLDGIGVLKSLAGRASPSVVVVMAEGPASLPGVFDVVRKPTALAVDQLYELGKTLAERVSAAAIDGRRR